MIYKAVVCKKRLTGITRSTRERMIKKGKLGRVYLNSELIGKKVLVIPLFLIRRIEQDKGVILLKRTNKKLSSR